MDWSETWLLWLLGFHASVWLFVILTRRFNEVQMVLLLSIRALRRRPVAAKGAAQLPAGLSGTCLWPCLEA